MSQWFQAWRAAWIPALLILFLGGIGLLLVSMTAPGLIFPQPPPPTLSPDARQLEMANNQVRSRPVQALYHVEALASQTGWTPDLHRIAGDLWSEIGDPVQASAHWQAASAQLDDPLLFRALAETQMQLADWTQAAASLEAIIALNPDNTWANYHLGLIRAIYNPDEAQSYLQQAALDPEFAEVARAVRVNLLENRERGALDDFTQPVRVGLLMVDYERWSYAELAFLHANTVSIANTGNPDPVSLAYAGLARDRQGKDGGGLVRQAAALAPQDPQILFLLALHHRRAGDYQASLDAMIQAVSLSPEEAVLYAELGTAYRLIGDLVQAERWLQAAVAFSGNAPEFEALLALFYAEEAYNLGSDGITALNETLQENPDDPDLRASFGWALYTLGDRELGLAEIDAALERSPNNPRALYYKARVLLGTGENPDEAVRLLERVVAADAAFSQEARTALQTLGN